MTSQQNPWAAFLEEEPGTRAAYYSYGDQWGGGKQQQRFYQNQFTDLYNQYLGTLGKQVRSGLMPQGRWNDYLGAFKWDDWYREQTTPEQRNPGYGGMVPQARWDVVRR